MTLSKNFRNERKKLILDYVESLSELNPNITIIQNTIDQSNSFIKDIIIEIDQLKTKNELFKLAHLAVLEKKLPDVKMEIDNLSDELSIGITRAEELAMDYRNVIQALLKATLDLNVDDPVKPDILSIISLNKMKIKNIENQISAASNQIALLIRFKTITLYHLSDSIKNNKKDRELPIVTELYCVEQQLQSRRRTLIWVSALTFLIAGYNYLASHYYYVTERIQKVPIYSNFPDHFDFLINMSEKAIIFITISIILINFFSVLFLLDALARRSVDAASFIAFIGATSSFGSAYMSSIYNNHSVVYIEVTSVTYYDFFNFGYSGTFSFMVLGLIGLFLAYRAYICSTTLKLLIATLDNKSDINSLII